MNGRPHSTHFACWIFFLKTLENNLFSIPFRLIFFFFFLVKIQSYLSDTEVVDTYHLNFYGRYRFYSASLLLDLPIGVPLFFLPNEILFINVGNYYNKRGETRVQNQGLGWVSEVE